jgi:hypothetical protein
MIGKRSALNDLTLIEEHLESMQRDSHGLEFARWKDEVDALWKKIFEHVNGMSPEPQQEVLELIRESWTSYLTHYAELSTE